MEEIQIIIEPNTVNPNSNTANTPVVAGTAGLTSTSAFYLPSPGSRLKLANTDNLGASPTSSDIRNWQELVLPSDTDEDKQQEQNKQTKPPILTPTHLSKAEPRLLPSLRILANSTYLPQVTNAPKGISLPPQCYPEELHYLSQQELILRQESVKTVLLKNRYVFMLVREPMLKVQFRTDRFIDHFIDHLDHFIDHYADKYDKADIFTMYFQNYTKESKIQVKPS